jgi:UDP-N-acetylmuramyl pentapeptide phosphotransferase/UDP-N-acetylglucosamine-1-phosphate transferase
MEFAMVISEMIYQFFDSIIPGLTIPGLYANLLLALAVSLTICTLNVATERWHGRYTHDLDTRGIQKVHKQTVPRTGGLALVAGIVAVACAGSFEESSILQDEESRAVMCKLLIAAIPAFAAGIAEDLTKKVSTRARLYSILLSACLAAWLLGATLPRVNIYGIDGVMGLLPVSIAVTVFAVAGVTNSINIIDGFHGVAGFTIVIILAGIGYLAWQANDILIMQLAFAGIGATAGFLALNYPTGRLFMGDGGAYFLGFWAAELAVLMVLRHPQINAWQILGIFAYPVIETVFSIYRRTILHNTHADAPDRLHLHSLFYRRFARHKINGKKHPWTCNAGVACFVATWIGAATGITLLAGDTGAAALALFFLQVVLYIAVYMRLVRGHWGHCRNLAVVLGLRPQPRSLVGHGEPFVTGPQVLH